MSGSVADRYAELLYGDDPITDPVLRAEIEAEAVARINDWDFIARPEQLPPDGDWTIWPYVAGRGAGKTRSGSEFMLDSAEEYDAVDVGMRGALIARTAADARDTMIEGESGIMACAERRGIKARYLPGKRKVELPDLHAAELHSYSAMEPESLRGPQHHRAWGDEPAAWRHIVDAQGNTAWSNAMFGLRLDAPGLRPRAMATTTPKPILIVKEWFDAVDAGDRRIVMTRGTLYDNIDNLAPAFAIDVVERYRNSPLGPQEIYGVLVLTVEGALWTPDRIQASRVDEHPRLSRRIVAVDPPSETAAECGIVTMGLAAKPEPSFDVVAGKTVRLPASRHVYVTGDYSMRGPSEAWGRRIVDAYHDTAANLVVVERNHGGDMIRAVIHAIDPSVQVKKIQASVSKWQRAEPVASVYSRVHHVAFFPMLEAQMTTWTEDDPVSPDRLDALVHGVRELLPSIVRPPAKATSAVDQRLAPVRTGGSRR